MLQGRREFGGGGGRHCLSQAGWFQILVLRQKLPPVLISYQAAVKRKYILLASCMIGLQLKSVIYFHTREMGTWCKWWTHKCSVAVFSKRKFSVVLCSSVLASIISLLITNIRGPNFHFTNIKLCIHVIQQQYIEAFYNFCCLVADKW